MLYRKIVGFVLILSSLIGCTGAPINPAPTSIPTRDEPAPTSLKNTLIPNTSLPQSSLADFEFPVSIDPAKRYLFYLHGKIVEDQGIPAISPDYGEYEYLPILGKLRGHDFVVISEQRPKGTDGIEYARDD
jgi:hypothetical protein